MQGHYNPTPVCSGFRVSDNEQVSKLYLLSAETSEVPEKCFAVGANAKLDITVIVLPGVCANVPINIDLCGEHSEVTLSGIFLCSGEDKLTFDICMHHRVGNCVSHQLFNGLAGGNADCKFFGRIIVAPDAQKTEAYQENHNIVISEKAKAETKPRLEIYADDVKCSHGATVGQLNEEEQFYMRSRGIPEEEAKALQMISFVAPILSHLEANNVETEELREKIETSIRTIV